MRFPSPLVPATLVKRYKRFLADVILPDGSTATAHCANPGAMLGLAVPGSRIWLSPSPNPKAKLDWRWEIEEADGARVGINTSHPNALIEEAIVSGMLDLNTHPSFWRKLEPQALTLAGHDYARRPEVSDQVRHDDVLSVTLRREVPYGINSRIDILLENTAGGRHYVEVKNVHLKRHGRAEFPDCVTSRGAKHLVELADMVQQGHQATMVYCIQRDDCESFAIAADLDPAYAAGLVVALKSGVQVVAVQCKVSVDEIVVSGPVRLEL